MAQLERAAAEESASGWPVMALEARLMAGQLALDRGWTSRGRQQLQIASQQRRQALTAGVPAAAALAHTQQRLASGDAATMATAAAFVCIGGEYTLPAAA